VDKTLREHISFLEERIVQLNKELMEQARTLEQRNRVETELRAAESAIRHYREALQLEAILRKSFPKP
jgi:hypothetical protein